MRTNIEIDDALMADVMTAFGARAKREAVDTALRNALQLRRQEDLLELRGMGWDGDLDDMRTSKYIPADR